MKVFLLFIGIIALSSGVKLIYDARMIVKKYFSVKNKNSATWFLKVFGTVCALSGLILVAEYL